jgi:hypothetical protein
VRYLDGVGNRSKPGGCCGAHYGANEAAWNSFVADTKVFLVKRQIPGSSYPAVTSSFLVQTVFDTSIGILVLFYAISQGLLPPLPKIP